LRYLILLAFLAFVWTDGQIFRECVLENWFVITPWYAMAHLIRFVALQALLGLFVIKAWRKH